MFLSLPSLDDEGGDQESGSGPHFRMFHSSDDSATSQSSDDEHSLPPPTPRDTTPRCCSIGRRVEMEDFTGNVMPAAMCLGDMDNDGTNELIVGNTSGELAVYKGLEQRSAWRKAQGLGSIACCAVADGLLWERHSSLAVITVEGWLHLFHIFPDRRDALLRPVHTERVPLNGCALLLRKRRGTGEAQDGHPPSGCCELCFGSTDGTVYSLLLTNASPCPPRLSLTLRIVTEWSVAFPLRSLFLQPKPQTASANAPTGRVTPDSKADRLQAE